MMEKNKEDRPQSPTDLLDEIARVATGKGGKTATKGTARRDRKKTESARRARRVDSRDEDSDSRPARRAAMSVRDGGPARDQTPMIIAIFVAIGVIAILAVLLSGGDLFGPPRASAPEETAAENRYEIADGAFQSAKFNLSVAENAGPLRAAFQEIVDHYPNTEAAAKAKKRLEELK
jgi:hypothetical protein